MKVVQTKAWSERRLKANRGCRYCPNCGEGKTEKKYLEEGNTWGDKIWGTVNGVGENRLGKILMKVREELRNA